MLHPIICLLKFVLSNYAKSSCMCCVQLEISCIHKLQKPIFLLVNLTHDITKKTMRPKVVFCLMGENMVKYAQEGILGGKYP
jgi:hypothetical protein